MMLTRLRFSRLFPISILSLVLAPAACVIVDSGDDSDDASANDTDTTDATDTEGGLCAPPMKLSAVLSFTIDGVSGAELTASCTVAAVSVGGGVMDLELECVDADAGMHEVLLSAPAVDTPSLEVGASGLELISTVDLGWAGPGPRFELSDAGGVIFAENLYVEYAGTIGPFAVEYGSHCQSEPGDGSPGFVRTTTPSDEVHEVHVGEPQVITDGEMQWDVIATEALDECCHGPHFNVALVRH